jgi:hypothetical protein
LDKDLVGSDKIGDVTVDFADIIQQNRPVDDWYKITGKTGLRSHGELRLAISFVHQQPY